MFLTGFYLVLVFIFYILVFYKSLFVFFLEVLDLDPLIKNPNYGFLLDMFLCCCCFF